MVSKICITFANEIRNDRSSLKIWVWWSWLTHVIWDDEIVGSYPTTHTINFECLRIFKTNNLVNSKICITFALGNERQGVLNNQNECKFFQRVL